MKKQMLILLTIMLCMLLCGCEQSGVIDSGNLTRPIAAITPSSSEVSMPTQSQSEPAESRPHLHSYEDVVIPPTCTESGYTSHYCSICGDTYIDSETEAMDHNWVNATCTLPQTCISCGLTQGDVIPHSWDEGVVLKEATEDTVGEMMHTCAVCAAIKIQEIPLLDHDYHGIITEPTYDEKGYTTYTCIRCGHCYISDYTDILRRQYEAGTLAFYKDGVACLYGENGHVKVSYTGWEEYVCRGPSYTPWYINREFITGVVIEDGVFAFYTDNWFYGCTNLAYVSLGNGVTRICESMFRECVSLTSIAIPDSVTRIDSFAFEGCTGLVSINIPNSVTRIGSNAFKNCTNLTSISIPDCMTGIGSDAFVNCGNLQYAQYDNAYYLGNDINPYLFLVKPVSKDIRNCMIHNNAKGICEDAFTGCYGLKYNSFGNGYYLGSDSNPYRFLVSVASMDISDCTIHDNTEVICSWAFNGCKQLTSISINNNVINIDASAFFGCESLTSITIPKGVTIIGDYAFYGCDRLKSIIIPDSVTIIGDHAFGQCRSLTSIVIPDRVTIIGRETFAGCEALMNVTFGSDLDRIEHFAFSVCESLTSVTIPEGTTCISMDAFHGCKNLANVIISSSVKKIGLNAFAFCPSLREILVEEGNAYYCSVDGVLYNKDRTVLVRYPGSRDETAFTIPDSVKKIAVRAFYDCITLTDLIIGNGLTTIDGYMFHGNTSLVNVTLGDCVTSIAEDAFSECSSLISVTMSHSVMCIGDDAFFNCPSLVSITFKGTIEQWRAIVKGCHFPGVRIICINDDD